MRWLPRELLLRDLTDADDDGRLEVGAGAADGVHGRPSASAVNLKNE